MSNEVGGLSGFNFGPLHRSADAPLVALQLEFEQNGAVNFPAAGLPQALANDYAGQIPCDHFMMGEQRSVSADASVSSGSPVFTGLHWVAPIGGHVSVVSNALMQGDRVANAVFTFVSHVGTGSQATMTYTFTGGYVTNLEVVNGKLHVLMTTRTVEVNDLIDNQVSSFEFYKA